MLKRFKICTSTKCLYFHSVCLFLSRPDQAAWSLEGKLWVTLFHGKPPVHSFVFSSEKSVLLGRLFFAWQFGCWNEALCVWLHTGSRWNSLSLAGDGGVSCWWPFFLAEPQEAMLSLPEMCALLHIRMCGSWYFPQSFFPALAVQKIKLRVLCLLRKAHSSDFVFSLFFR